MDNTEIARRIYELREWHTDELPEYRGLPPQSLVQMILSRYSSPYEIQQLIDDTYRLRRPTGSLPKPEVAPKTPIDVEDTIRVGSDLPAATEHEKLTRAEKEYWAGVQALRPIVWEYRRNPLRAAAGFGVVVTTSTFGILIVAALLGVFVVGPMIAWLWRILMRALSDVASAVRGK